MTSGVTGTGSASNGADTGSTGYGNAKVDKNMFLQLLVAQLRNQDPLNPADGTEFVGQLAQFQQMESTLNMGQDMTAIRETLDLILAGISPATAA
jgi:flagellar basal-body rod modification protein FlgD